MQGKPRLLGCGLLLHLTRSFWLFRWHVFSCFLASEESQLLKATPYPCLVSLAQGIFSKGKRQSETSWLSVPSTMKGFVNSYGHRGDGKVSRCRGRSKTPI